MSLLHRSWKIYWSAWELICICPGSLLKLQVDEEHVEMICEWADKPEHEHMRTYGSLPLAEVPFMTGRPYTISSETDYAKAIFRLFYQV